MVESKTLLNSYLWKEGGIYKSWKKRWFSVEENGTIIKYYVNESKEICKGSILISSIISVKPTSQVRRSTTINTSHSNLSNSIHNIPIDVNSRDHSNSSNSNNVQVSTTATQLSQSNNSSNNSNNSNCSGNNNNSNTTGNNGGNLTASQLLSSSLMINSLIASDSSSSPPQEWVFSIITQPRTYTLRAMSESEMYYWIQGIRNIQLESNIVSFTNAQRERTSKTLTKSNNGNIAPVEAENEMLKQEVTKLSYQCSEMKQHFNEIKYEFKIAVKDHKNLINIIHEQYKRYNMELERQHNKQLKQSISPNIISSVCTIYNSNNNNNNNNNNLNQSSGGQDGVPLTPTNLNNNKPNNSNSPLSASSASQNNNNNQNSPTPYLKAPNGMALWHPDNSSSYCFTCKSLFTLVKRRHHCRHCGGLFCSTCSNQSAKAQGYAENVRVCIQCAQLIWTTSRTMTNPLSFN